MRVVKRVMCSVVAVISLITGGTAFYDHTKPVGKVVIENEPLGLLRISQKGLAIAGNAEGCQLMPYKCPAGLLTNGIGNTHNVPGQAITLDQVAKDWVVNIKDAERCIGNAEKLGKLAMTQGQFDAFTSFGFNTGCPRFMRNQNGSYTRIYSYIKNGEYLNACKELPKWVYGGGKKLNGLVNRRRQEYDRCIEVD
jgi:lysozyme